jgi:hypothetical protein
MNFTLLDGIKTLNEHAPSSIFGILFPNTIERCQVNIAAVRNPTYDVAGVHRNVTFFARDKILIAIAMWRIVQV